MPLRARVAVRRAGVLALAALVVLVVLVVLLVLLVNSYEVG